MSEWWTYRLEDFLLFSPRVYWRMFELHNAQFWPVHLLTFAAGLASLIVLLRRPHDGRWVALMLAVLWVFVAWSFLWNRYAAINWAVAYLVPVFAVEALLLAIAAVRGLAFDDGWSGLPIVTLGVVAYPLLPLFFGRPWSQAEVFGIVPDPTAIATLGILLSSRGSLPLLLFPIPLAWLLVSGLTLNTMGDAQGWLLFFIAGTAIALLIPRFLNRWREP